MSESKIILDVPEMTQEQYAEKVGLSLDTIKGWVKRGYLPTVKVGKYRMINVYKRSIEIAREEDAA